MTIYIASDHGGFDLKNKLTAYLESQDKDVKDTGPNEYIEHDDYPDYVIPLMKKLRKEPQNCAILICRNGVGVCMTANRFKGIRAGISWDEQHAKSLKRDDNTNVLCLGADYLDFQKATEIVDAWIGTKFENLERHKRRLEKLNKI